jgi:TonB family protein
MLGPIVLAILVAGAAFSSPIATQATATQQPSASPVQTTAEKPWPPPGVVRAGVGDVSPRVITQTRASYLPQAMHEKIAGVIELEAVVETDGTVSKVRVKRSLDRKFGLDDEAVRTVKEWQFAPGKKDGIAWTPDRVVRASDGTDLFLWVVR